MADGYTQTTEVTLMPAYVSRLTINYGFAVQGAE